MAGRRRTKTEPAGASANNSLTEDDPELVAENNKDESEKNGPGQASTSSTTGTYGSDYECCFSPNFDECAIKPPLLTLCIF